MHCFYNGNRQHGTEHSRNHSKGLTSRDYPHGDTRQWGGVESSGQAGTEATLEGQSHSSNQVCSREASSKHLANMGICSLNSVPNWSSPLALLLNAHTHGHSTLAHSASNC